jgi:hypothetical protein
MLIYRADNSHSLFFPCGGEVLTPSNTTDNFGSDGHIGTYIGASGYTTADVTVDGTPLRQFIPSTFQFGAYVSPTWLGVYKQWASNTSLTPIVSIGQSMGLIRCVKDNPTSSAEN